MPFPPAVGSSSPWGAIQTVEPLGPDAMAVTTASHGGVRVSEAAYARLPEAIRATAYSGAGWFEEDCDWALPYLALGLDAFEADPARARRCARPPHGRSNAGIRSTPFCWASVPETGPMAEQGDLFRAGVAEAPASALAWRLRPVSVEGLDEEATLAQLLARCGPAAGDPDRLADALLARFGGIGRVLGAPQVDLARVAGEAVAAELATLHALLVRVLEHPLQRRPLLGSWDAAKTYVRARIAALPCEVFHVLFLDVKNQLIADERMGEGSISHAPVYPREVVRRALELSASSLLLAHNHPTGDPTPSKDDIEITKKVVAAARALGIAVHDHLIVGGDQVASLKTLGLM